jgi:hypothetical protein
MTLTFPRIGFAIIAIAIGQIATLNASIISYTGNLRAGADFTACGPGCVLGAGSLDSDYAQWAAVSRTFHVSTASTMTAITFSYGGGANGSGTVIADAGFEPYLSLFDAAGNFLNSTFFGTTCPPGAHTSPALGSCFDVLLNGGTLAAGDYRITISAFQNLSFAENFGTGTLADGFTGLGNLAQGEDLHYAFDVSLTSTSSVPEPASALLVAGGFAVCLFIRKRKTKFYEN